MNARADEADELDAALMGTPHRPHGGGVRVVRLDGEEGGSHGSMDDDEFFDVSGAAAGQGAPGSFSLPATLH